MSSFEYVSVLLSIVLALGVAHILTGVAAMIERWRQLERDWVFLAWCVATLAIHVGYWGALWRFHQVPRWTVGALLYWFGAVATLFLTSRLLVPAGPPPPDMHQHFAAIRRPFFGALTAYWLLASVGPLFVTSRWITPYRPFVVGFTLLALSGALVSSRRYHAVLTVVWLLVYLAYWAFFEKPIA